jgi:hypothetical protein
VGDKCTNSPVESDVHHDVISTAECGATGGSPNTNDFLLQQLVSQMTNMNILMEKQTDILMSMQREKQLNRSPIYQQTPDDDIAIETSISPDTRPDADNDHVDAHIKGIPAHVNTKLMASVQKGEYISLYDLLPKEPLPSNEIMAVQNKNGTVSFQPKKAKSLDNFDNWLTAWNVYEHLVIMHKPELYYRLSQYRQFIHMCDRKFQWHAVSTYDKSFRAKLSETNSFAFDTIDNMMYVSIMDVTAIRSDTKQCFRCKSIHHLISDCPFPSQDKVGKDSQAPPKRFPPSYNKFKSTAPERWMHDGREICNNWQIANCRYPNCNRAHVCKGCRGNVPFSRCTTCNHGQYTS